jgi:hypothetical protein
MPFAPILESSFSAPAGLKLISWEAACHFCHKPISRDYPLAIMSLQQAAWIGVSHVECGESAFGYARFSLPAPGVLNSGQISFLVHFYPALFKLPGWGHSRSALRRCLASLLLNYPQGWYDPAPFLRTFIQENQTEIEHYPDDLEADFFNFLAEVQASVITHPLDIELDFDSALIIVNSCAS